MSEDNNVDKCIKVSEVLLYCTVLHTTTYLGLRSVSELARASRCIVLPGVGTKLRFVNDMSLQFG